MVGVLLVPPPAAAVVAVVAAVVAAVAAVAEGATVGVVVPTWGWCRTMAGQRLMSQVQCSIE